ncbi:MAG: hypothetical protein HY763_11225 [Planctomycetes bacterium]|nr:hypothetical protein [Planctomycetota bacterium]
MIRYECDRCGESLGANDARRFIVKFEIFAAAGHVELSDDARDDPQSELDAVMRQLAEADPDEMEDQTYRSFRFDVCDDCRKKLIAHPLG